MVKDVESRLSYNLKMCDERITSQLSKDVEELKSKIDFNFQNSEDKHDDLKYEVKTFTQDIDDTVKKDDFEKAVVRISLLK